MKSPTFNKTVLMRFFQCVSIDYAFLANIPVLLRLNSDETIH